MKIFINPVSGGGKGAGLADRLSKYEPIIVQPDKIKTQVETNVGRGDTLVVIGGDGTISLVVGALYSCGLGEHVRLYPYPLGTGNDLCRALGGKKIDVVSAIDSVMSNSDHRVVSLPIWQYNETFFACYFSLGLDARILASVDTSRRLFPRYRFLTNLLYLYYGLYHSRYSINEHITLETPQSGRIDLAGKAGLILCNINFFAGGSPIGSEDISANQLAVVVLNSYVDLLKLVASRVFERALSVNYFNTETIRIDGGKVPAQMDGEISALAPTTIQMAGKIDFIVLT